ncbi:MAG: DUF4857 domain-containing protein [Pseudomonadota bacterium]
MSVRNLAWLVMTALVALLLSIAGPRLIDLAFDVERAPTHLFFSPVSRTFVFREHHGGHDFVYGDNRGETFDRRTFETRLPFVYYRNMDLWGLLPLDLDGRRFDAQTIRENRQVFELRARQIADRRPSIAVYPLLEANPGQARLQFPEDVFRFTGEAMEFVNVDTNRVDPALTERFTTALVDAGFAFPARAAFGQPTILKPFDDGWFVVDAAGAVFHVRRVDGAPEITRTPIPTDLDIRHIEVVENERREIRALLLTDDARLFLVRHDGYRLVPLPTDGYVPDRMDYKLLINPLYATAVYGDGERTHAVAMTKGFVPLEAYSRPAPPRDGTLGAWLAAAAFPWTVSLEDADGTRLVWQVLWGGLPAATGLALALLSALLLARTRAASPATTAACATLALAFGPPAVAALLATPWPRTTAAAPARTSLDHLRHEPTAAQPDLAPGRR